MARVLNLWRHDLGEVPESVWSRTDLEVLILADNALATLSPKVGLLRHLHTLDLGHNALTAVPREVGELPALTEFLYLHDNQLTELPTSFGRLTRLRYLNISENRLTQLPDGVGELGELVELRAQHNKLSGLPDTIGRLSQLRELWLRGNTLECLPESVAELTQLRHLDHCAAVVTAAVERFGRLDLAFDNAGIGPEGKPLTEGSPESWETILAVNLTGVAQK